ncbi:hypothetical protein N9001_07855, partial [Akkermansiaceae bacterium]|nr:hypothetical protein [Akkermansiaceae bacterium]
RPYKRTVPQPNRSVLSIRFILHADPKLILSLIIEIRLYVRQLAWQKRVQTSVELSFRRGNLLQTAEPFKCE